MNRALMVLCLMPFVVYGQSAHIQTIAGTGVSGELGDGTAATTAQISAAGFGIFDSDNNFYFVEGPGNRVRKINSRGIITAFAGTGSLGFTGDGSPATSAT